MSVQTPKRSKSATGAKVRSSHEKQVKNRAGVPLVDVFAGCGGFSEGFLSYRNGRHSFDLALAIDNDAAAHRTHLLRAFFHQFKTAPSEYYALVNQSMTMEELFSCYPRQARAAKNTVILHELGGDEKTDQQVLDSIPGRIGNQRDWVLIGGPPCQAYSLAGRARNRGVTGYRAEDDHRHFLYREYLKIIAGHWPSVFVMENVTGILSARLGANSDRMWEKILEDLTDPVGALGMTELASDFDGYRLYSLVTPWQGTDLFGKPTLKPDDYVVRCERYGVPQARHRVFILGVRSDITVEPGQLVPHKASVSSGSVINDLPPLRSGLTNRGKQSTSEDTNDNWLLLMRKVLKAHWWDKVDDDRETFKHAKKSIRKLSVPANERGGEFVHWKPEVPDQIPEHLSEWYADKKLKGVCNHMTKAHMESDVHRYVFAASYSKAGNDKLKLKHFPDELLPDHKNVKSSDPESGEGEKFVDRFSVVKSDAPSQTIVRHLAKDGHYYIHPDVSQARSLTVREAARLQTFPDNFYFPDSRTEQYCQVGNAVPPYLACQIAALVDDLLTRAGR